VPGNPRSGVAVESAADRRRPPPLTVARRRLRARVRPEPLDQDLTVLADPPALFKLAPPAAIRSTSNGSERVSRVNTGQTGRPSHVCRKPPVLFGFHKNTLLLYYIPFS
jgi:hypothetical protein